MFPEAHVPNKKILKYVKTSVLRSKRTSWGHARKIYQNKHTFRREYYVDYIEMLPWKRVAFVQGILGCKMMVPRQLIHQQRDWHIMGSWHPKAYIPQFLLANRQTGELTSTLTTDHSKALHLNSVASLNKPRSHRTHGSFNSIGIVSQLCLKKWSGFLILHIHCSKISIFYAIQPINNKSQCVVTLQKYLKRYHTR